MLIPPPSGSGRGKRSTYVPPRVRAVDTSILDEPDAEYDPSGDDYAPEDRDVDIPKELVDSSRLTIRESDEFKGVLYEIIQRKSEALKLFVPIPEQERFFASESGERIALGGNRGGKTSAVCVEIARAVTGQDPYDKYPKEGKCILVGKDLTHCSKIFYQKLFKPGAFKMIRDEVTGEWRPFHPDVDAARSGAAKKAPPLIPRRFYDFKKIAWEDKKNEVPKTVTLHNGWSMHFFSSLGAPPQGWNVALVAFDEEIEHPLWYPEMAARLLDDRTVDQETGKVRGGKFVWSATPQAGTQGLYDLKSSADQLILVGDDTPRIQCFEFGMLDNPWVATASKEEFIAKFATNEDEIAVRVYGQFALLGTRVYSEFMPKGAHGIDSFPIPEDWTSYVIIDPGRQVCAVLFVAIPSPGHELRGRKIIYDELYIKRCNAKIFAETFVSRVNGRPIEFGVIDHRAGRITEIGSGKTHEQQYTDALKAAKFRFEQGGSSFVWSSDDVKGGIEAVHNALHIIDGKTGILVMRDKCPKLLWEMERYSYRRTPGGVVTDEPIKLNDHAVDALRYLCMAKLHYVKPRQRKQVMGYTNLYLKQKAERKKNAQRQIMDGSGSFKVG